MKKHKVLEILTVAITALMACGVFCILARVIVTSLTVQRMGTGVEFLSYPIVTFLINNGIGDNTLYVGNTTLLFVVCGALGIVQLVLTVLLTRKKSAWLAVVLMIVFTAFFVVHDSADLDGVFYCLGEVLGGYSLFRAIGDIAGTSVQTAILTHLLSLVFYVVPMIYFIRTLVDVVKYKGSK